MQCAARPAVTGSAVVVCELRLRVHPILLEVVAVRLCRHVARADEVSLADMDLKRLL